MATKKRKRFNEGGSTEAQDKAAGLEASKDERVGFAGLGRFFMGSIDDPKSEAYRRFGAGRGRAEKVPVEDRVAVPVTKAAPETPKVEMDELEAANQREPIPVPAGPRANIRPGGRPSVSVASSAKPAASKPTAPAPARASASGAYRADSGPGKLGMNYSNEGRSATRLRDPQRGAAAAGTAPVTDTGSDVGRMLARAPAPAKAAPAEKKSSYETPYDRMNRQNREAEASRRSAADDERATLRKNLRERNTGRVNPNTLLPESAMKKGGSVKGWGMARGARKAKIV